MISISKNLRTSVVAALLLAGIGTVAQGQVPGGGSSFGGTGRGLTIIKGSMVCVDCSLEEVRKAQPHERKLYQLSHKQRQMVMKVTAVNESARFDSLVWPPELRLRGTDSLLNRLGAEENLFKEMLIVGLLHNSRTLDIFDVTVEG